MGGGGGLFRENWATPPLMFIRNRILPALGVTRVGSSDEEPLSAKELLYLDEVFSGNVCRIVERFVFFSSIKQTSLGYRPLVTCCRCIDDMLYHIPSLRQYSYTGLIYLVKQHTQCTARVVKKGCGLV